MEWLGDLERSFATSVYPNRVLIAVLGVALLAILGLVARRRRWDRIVQRHPRRTGAGLVMALAIAGPIAWYLGSPLFVSSSIDEPLPIAAVDPSPPPSAPNGLAATPSTPTESAPAPTLATPSSVPVAATRRSGSFTGADDFHFGRGDARLVETAPGAFIVRLEGFEVRNGPDLYVYLSPSKGGYATGAVELGRLKADRGNQNYRVPDGTDVGSARSVVIWCKQFGVLFATAPLT